MIRKEETRGGEPDTVSGRCRGSGCRRHAPCRERTTRALTRRPRRRRAESGRRRRKIGRDARHVQRDGESPCAVLSRITGERRRRDDRARRSRIGRILARDTDRGVKSVPEFANSFNNAARVLYNRLDCTPSIRFAGSRQIVFVVFNERHTSAM